MPWTFDNNGFDHAGTDKDVRSFVTRTTGTCAVVGTFIDPSKPAGFRIYGSPLLDTAYQVIVTGGTGGSIEIRKIVFGTPAGAASATTVHGLLTGDNYRLEIRLIAGVITVYLNNASTPLLTFDTAGDLAGFTTFGIYSETDGARVAGIKLYALTQTFATLAEVYWAVIGGTLYASDTGPDGLRVIAAGICDATVPWVTGAEIRQQAFIVDGSKIVRFDAVTMTAAMWTGYTGTLPGETTPGTTTARLIYAWSDRLLLLFEQQGKASRLGDETDFDTSTDLPGKAFVFQAGQTGQPGSPMIGAYVPAKNRLLLFCEGSKYELTGDPAIQAELTRISDSAGSTGPFSAALCGKGRTLVHSELGLEVIPEGGSPEELSRNVLTEIIQLADPTAYLVIVIRDIQLHGVWVFMTPLDGTSRGRHIFYDERVGQFKPSNGGMFPVVFGGADLEPTTATRYQGKVIIGTRGGKLLHFTANSKTDNGTPFDWKLPLELMRSPDGDSSVLLWDFSLMKSIDSDDVAMTLKGGEVPERAWHSTGWTLWNATATNTRDSFYVNQASPALVMTLSGTGTRAKLEAAFITYKLDVLVQEKRLPALVPEAPCAPPLHTTPDMPDGPDTGPGPGGGTGECTACADWMAANTTGDVGGQPAYLLASDSTLALSQGTVVTALANLAMQNICDLGDDPMVYVTTGDAAFVTPQPMLASDFAALVPGDYDPTEKTWRVYFRCGDQVA